MITSIVTTEDSFVDIYPNPVKDNLLIDFSGRFNYKATVEIMSITGKIIKRIAKENNRRILNIDLNGISNGLYLIRINQQETSIVRKLVVDK